MANKACVWVAAVVTGLIGPPLGWAQREPVEAELTDLTLSLAEGLAQEPDLAELWAVFDRCEAMAAAAASTTAEVGSPAHAPLCGLYAQRLGELAEGSDRQRLLDRLGSEDDPPFAEDLLKGLLRARIVEQIADLPEPGRPLGPRQPRDLPEHLAAAAPAFQAAWRLQESLRAAHDGLLERGENGPEAALPYFGHRADFDATLLALVRGDLEAGEAIATLRRFQWGGGCGFGSQAFAEPRDLGVLLALLSTGDRAAAAGALLQARRASEWGGQDLPDGPFTEDWARQALARLGFDWEAVELGRFLDGWPQSTRQLALHGSAPTLRLLWEARDLTDAETSRQPMDDATYLHAVASLVEPTDRCSDYGVSSSEDVVRAKDAPFVGAEAEAEILAALESRVGPDAGLDEAETAAHLLVRACREESLPAFRRMARSQYAKVRQAGSVALRAWGERPPPARENRPVRVHVAVDGAPYTQPATYMLTRSGEGFRGQVESGNAGRPDGLVEIPRDPFLDPKGRIDRVSVQPARMTSPASMWFYVSLPRPRDLDTPLVATVATQSLTLVCPQAETGGLRLTVAGQVDRGEEEGYLRPILMDWTWAPSQSSVTLPRLQRGRYRWHLWSPEHRLLWNSDDVTLGAKPATSTCGDFQTLDFGPVVADADEVEPD